MLVQYERISYDRQQRAMERWEKWQEEWRQFQKSMCKRMGKAPKDLIVSRVHEVREKKEEYDFINAATPHNEKHGDEYWQMSLRGIGTRYVAVGNIFSGIFCPIREVDNPELEAVRLSSFYNMGNPAADVIRNPARIHDKGAGSSRKSWRDAPILKARRARVKQRLEALRPHEAAEGDRRFLGIQGEPLFEWAYNSMEHQHMSNPNIEDEDGNVRDGAQAKSSPAASQRSGVGPLTGPNIKVSATCEESAVRKDGSLRVLLENYTGQPTSRVIQIDNTGTTAIYYGWTRSDTLAPKIDCKDTQGVVLPGDKKSFEFSFVSPVAGELLQKWFDKSSFVRCWCS